MRRDYLKEFAGSDVQIFTDAEGSLRYSLNPRVVLESACLKSAQPENDYNIDALMARISKLEKMLAEDEFLEGTMVSSGEIRRLLTNGDITRANRLLGAPYAVSAEIVTGAAIGRTIGFPTANQLFEDNQLVPKFGVYRAET